MHRARNSRKSQCTTAFVKKKSDTLSLVPMKYEIVTDLAAFGVVTMFEESNIEVLDFPRQASGLLEVKMLPKLSP